MKGFLPSSSFSTISSSSDKLSLLYLSLRAASGGAHKVHIDRMYIQFYQYLSHLAVTSSLMTRDIMIGCFYGVIKFEEKRTSHNNYTVYDILPHSVA